MELGEAISYYRRQRGLTIDQLVEKSGVPKGTLNKIMNGVTNSPKVETVKAIAAALDISLSDLDAMQQKDEVPAKAITIPRKLERVTDYSTALDESRHAIAYGGDGWKIPKSQVHAFMEDKKAHKEWQLKIKSEIMKTIREHFFTDDQLIAIQVLVDSIAKNEGGEA